MNIAERLYNLQECFQGKTITILAGAEKEQLTVHERAFAMSGSLSLEILVHGHFKEASTHVIDWSHTESATVSRFLTYLYIGNYNAPWPTRRPNLSDSDPIIVEPAEAAVSEEVVTEETVEMAVAEETILEEPAPEPVPEPVPEPAEGSVVTSGVDPETVEPEPVSDLIDDAPAFQDAILESINTRPLTPIKKCIQTDRSDQVQCSAAGTFDRLDYPYQKYCYVEPMLAHARLYALGTYHLCPPLQTLALRRLVQILEYLDCWQGHATEEISVLASYVYDNTSSPRNGEEPMRKVISTFIALNYEQLFRAELEELLYLGGDLARDVNRKVLRRLCTAQRSVEGITQENRNLEQEVSSLKQKLDSSEELSSLSRAKLRKHGHSTMVR